MITCKSAGDLGDICLSLCIVKHHCDRLLQKAVFYLEDAPYTTHRMTAERRAIIEPLLRRQYFIEDVREYKGEPVDFNLNDFRAPMFKARRAGKGIGTNLLDWMCDVHGVPRSAKEERWLEVDLIDHGIKTVINRSPRYHNPAFPWRRMINQADKPVTFLGLEREHKAFMDYVGVSIPFVHTPNLLQAAQIIESAEIFIGNQSCLHAIAEGLKKPIVLEVFPQMPNCIFHRQDVAHGWNGMVQLPKHCHEEIKFTGKGLRTEMDGSRWSTVGT